MSKLKQEYTVEEKAHFFDKIADRYHEGESVQDEWDLYHYCKSWVKELIKEIK